MAWLNYQHLFYFWTIAREGGLAKGAAALHLTHSTLSVQLRSLEAMFGEPLFERRGRALVLTPFGRDVQQYANEIFRLGEELVDFSRGRTASARRLEVGSVGAIPKTMVTRILMPALDIEQAGAVRIRQDTIERLVQELGTGRLHVVISDAVPPQLHGLGLHAHPIGSTRILIYATEPLATRYRRGFPGSLDDAPMLMPGPDASLRRSLERWFANRGLRVRTVGEIDDAGTLRAFGAAGRGLFPVREALKTEVEEGFGARRIGRLPGVVESYFAISLERRVRHQGVAALIDEARRRLRS